MSLHPYPADYNVTSFEALFTYVNAVSGNMFFALVCIAAWIVIFVSLKSYTTAKALATASYVLVIISGLFWLLGLVTYYVIVVFVVLAILGALFPMLKGGGFSGEGT